MLATNHRKRAFSLVELSIVVLVISIVIAGITKSSVIYEKYRIAMARELTQSSPVHSINDLVVWYETTMKNSFNESESQDYDELTSAEQALGIGVISTWKDNSEAGEAKKNATQSTLGYRPKYHLDCINDLPCLEFDGSDDFLLMPTTVDLTSKEYTIFIVEKKDNSGSEPYLFLGSNSATSTNSDSVNLGYYSSTELYYSQGSTTDYYTAQDVAIDNNDNILMHSFIGAFKNSLLTTKVSHRMFDNDLKSYLYDNGTSSFSYTGTSGDNLRIGSGYDGSTETFYKGKIGEIIIFKRALKASERKSVEEYLMKKWKLINNSTPMEILEIVNPPIVS